MCKPLVGLFVQGFGLWVGIYTYLALVPGLGRGGAPVLVRVPVLVLGRRLDVEGLVCVGCGLGD